MTKVLLIGAEVAPFVKAGGLADVLGALPKELRRQGVDARVIMPKYSDIPWQYREKMHWVKSLYVPVGWRYQFCGVEVMEYEGVPIYFIDNEYYFKRPGIYGYNDDAERYAFFSRAALEVLPHIDFQPDVIHANDWHTALCPLFLRSHYASNPFFQNMKAIFTIHNMKFQGQFGYNTLFDLLGLGPEYFTSDKLEYKGDVNFMKGGIVYSDYVTTVSETYAREIQEPQYGEGLDGLLRARSNHLYGIVNGIDIDVWNPETDKIIANNFKVEDADTEKVKNKLALQEALGLKVDADVPMMAMVSRLTDQKGMDLIAQVFDSILGTGAQLVVLGTGQSEYEQLLWNAQYNFPEQVSANIFFDEELAHKIYASADMFLMPSRFEPCGLGQIIAMRYGTLPVVRETGGLYDTVETYEEGQPGGTGFSFSHINAQDMLHVITEAVKLYKDKTVWYNVVRNAMGKDYSWQVSAAKYLKLYES